MNRVSNDENKIVVKVADSHLQKTKFGYALILDQNHVTFLKDWQVNQNYFGNEVLLNRDYWNPKEWGEFEDFGENPENLEWITWLEIAKEQNGTDDDGIKINPVKWEK